MTPAQIKTARESIGWTQQEFADFLGFTNVTWCRWECGGQAVPPPVAICIAYILKFGVLDRIEQNRVFMIHLVGTGMTPAQIEKARSEIGWTQQGFADFIGVHLRTWHAWEHGERGIPNHVAVCIAYILKFGVLDRIEQNRVFMIHLGEKT